MADFALSATACETALWPREIFAAAYWKNRRAAIDEVIDADPVAACVRHIMAQDEGVVRNASDLLSAGVDAHRTSVGGALTRAVWPKNSRALASRLRRAQTFLRAIGIEVAFGREGRQGDENDPSDIGTRATIVGAVSAATVSMTFVIIRQGGATSSRPQTQVRRA